MGNVCSLRLLLIEARFVICRILPRLVVVVALDFAAPPEKVSPEMPLSHQLPSACLRTSPRRILQFPSGIRTLQCRTLSQFARLPAATLRHNLSGNVTTHAAHQRRTFISKYLPKKLTSSFLAGRSRAAQAQLLKPAPGEQYGQQLMIYRIGARSFLLGPLKIYAVLQFAYCVGYVIPSAWDPEEWWWAAAAAAASIVPLVFLGYLRSVSSCG